MAFVHYCFPMRVQQTYAGKAATIAILGLFANCPLRGPGTHDAAEVAFTDAAAHDSTLAPGHDSTTSDASALQWNSADNLSNAELCRMETSGAQRPACCAMRTPMPLAVKRVIDLHDVMANTSFLCSIPNAFDPPGAPPTALELPADIAAYPLKIVLPSLPVTHASCAANCDRLQRETQTSLSVAFRIRLANPSYVPVLVVTPPWRLVNGGDGDPQAYRCLGGYQEFGERTCQQLAYGQRFGVAIAQPSGSAPGELLVDVRPRNNTQPDEPAHCCPFLPRAAFNGQCW